jgi:hypothetical protein
MTHEEKCPCCGADTFIDFVGKAIVCESCDFEKESK